MHDFLPTIARSTLALAAISLATILFTTAGSLRGAVRLTDVSETAGVDGDIYSAGTGHGLGVNWVDFDVDGWPDLFVVGGGPGSVSHLFRNRGDGTFERADDLLPPLPDVELTGSIFADYDRDGDPDLFIYTDSDDWRTMSSKNPPDGPPNILLRNRWRETGIVAGQPLFVDVAAAAGVDTLAEPPHGTLPGLRAKTAAWLDYDRDGCIDLFVGHMVINSGGHVGNRDRFYRNRCDGTFEDATAPSGVNLGVDPGTYRASLAAGGFHLDGDLWPDLYVVHATALDPGFHDDFVFRNEGPDADGQVRFREQSHALVGIGNDAQAGMGLDVADVDNDGDWDLYISDLLDTELDDLPRGNVFYLGDGVGGFQDNAAPAAGIAGNDSWGVNFFDVDNDGLEDLFVSTIITAASEFLYRNEGVGTDGQIQFTNVAPAAGLATGDSRGSAVADYDRDGDLDVAVVNQNGPLQLFRNDTDEAGHWLVLTLEGRASNLDAIGAVVEVTTGDVVRRRQVKGGSSAHSQDSLSVHFGLGSVLRADQVRVRWPSGDETLMEEVDSDRYLHIIERRVFVDGFESGSLAAWTSTSSTMPGALPPGGAPPSTQQP